MCEIIKNGKVEMVEARTGYGAIYNNRFNGCPNDIESFYTRGGLSHTLRLMRERGVKECSYKTCRYAGHHRYIQFMIDDCKMTKDVFCEAIKNACSSVHEDTVLMAVGVDNNQQFYKIDHDEEWTAMQRTTAFPTAVVAALIAEGKMPDEVMYDYSHVPFDEFKERLEGLGLFLNPT